MAANKKHYIDIFCQYCGVLATRKVKNQKGVKYPCYCKACEKIPENVKRVGYFNDIVNGCLLHLETQTKHPVFVDREAKQNGYYPIYASQDSWEGGLTTVWWYQPNRQLYSFIKNDQPALSFQYQLYWEEEAEENSERDQSWTSIPSPTATQRQLPLNGKKQSCLERGIALLKSLFLS